MLNTVYKIGQKNRYIVPVISGISGNREFFRKLVARYRIEKVLLPMAPEELYSLRVMLTDGTPYVDTTAFDDLYINIVGREQIVELPDPGTALFVMLEREGLLELEAIDLSEESFSELYCKYISTYSIYRHDKLIKTAKGIEYSSIADGIVWVEDRLRKIGGFEHLVDDQISVWVKRLAADDDLTTLFPVGYEKFRLLSRKMEDAGIIPVAQDLDAGSR